MPTTPEKILALAASQIGIKESPANSNNVKYNTAYYGREINNTSYHWCVVFIWWLFRELGASSLFYGGSKTASCTTLYTYHKKQGQAVTGNYQPGDLIFFNFSGGTATHHIGICESYNGTNIVTIDGNTGTTSEANGGAVMRRTRAKKYIVAAYRPAYATQEEPATPEPKQEEKEVTQEQFNEMFAIAMAALNKEIEAKPVSDWAKESWDKQVTAGVFDGTKPQAALTREQAATVITRLKGE